MRFYFLFLFIIAFNPLPSQTKTPDAIVLYAETEIFFEGNGNVKIKKRKQVKVNRKEGQEFATFYEYYDKLSKISKISIKLYDKNYAPIDLDPKKIIIDQHIDNRDNSFDDNRVVFALIDQIDFPFYVKYEYEKNLTGNLMVPDWYPLESNEIPVNYAKLDIYAHPSIDFRYRAYNIEKDSLVSNEGLNTHYSFVVDSLNPISVEPYSPPVYDLMPMVLISPLNFNYDETNGSTSSWQSFGRWAQELLNDRDFLPEETKNDIQAIKSSTNDTTEIVKLIYHYMQNRTRYVSIQFGIGGFQPLSASYVSENKFGDCKALSNYMVSLLKEAGIRSNYTLVRAGKSNPIEPNFPSQQFNHVIVNVPLKNDTLWLECTNQEQLFNYLGSFTSNRYALSLGTDSIRLVKTPDYSAIDNIEQNISILDIDDQGNAIGTISIALSGLNFEFFEALINLSETEQKKWIFENIDLQNYQISEFSFQISEGRIPKAELILSVELNYYANITGKRLFVPVKPLSKINKTITGEKRTQDIFIKNSYTKVDSAVFTFSNNFDVEYIPDSISYQNDFGRLTSYVLKRNNTLIFFQERVINKGRYDIGDYNEFKKFHQMIYKCDNNRLIVKKTI